MALKLIIDPLLLDLPLPLLLPPQNPLIRLLPLLLRPRLPHPLSALNPLSLMSS